MRGVVRTILGVLVASRLAGAQPEAEERHTVADERHSTLGAAGWERRPLAVALHLGIATPFGVVGLSGDWAFVPELSLEAGVGTNLRGVQLSTMLRARFTPRRAGSFYFGAGYSQGPHAHDESTGAGLLSLVLAPLSSIGHDTPRGHTWDPARWLNAELGHERRLAAGQGYRFYLGVASLLNASNAELEPGPDDARIDAISRWMLYSGFAMSYGFEL